MKTYDIAKEMPNPALRAEILAAWYLRFNGFFLVQNFILHDAGLYKQIGGQLTEADSLAIRLPHTKEDIKGKGFKITPAPHQKLDVNEGVADFIICEVTSAQCKLNWIHKKNDQNIVNQEYIEYALRRFGYWQDAEIESIAEELSKVKDIQIKQTDKDFHSIRVRLLTIGNEFNKDISDFRQIVFAEILDYFKNELFLSYSRQDALKKIVSDHSQWDPLICEVYKRLLGHKTAEESVNQVVTWLFPNK